MIILKIMRIDMEAIRIVALISISGTFALLFGRGTILIWQIASHNWM